MADVAIWSDIELQTVVDCAAILLANASVQEHVSSKRPSALNNDGSALQVCETCSTGGSTMRIIADPGRGLEDARTRHEASLETLGRTLEVAGGTGLRELCDTTLALGLPGEPDQEPDLAPGTLWLAASPAQPGVALYVNGRWGPVHERWSRAGRWLLAVAPSACAAEFIESASQVARVASLAVEGPDRDRARAKVYFRLANRVQLNELGIAVLSQDAVAEFLDITLGPRAIPTLRAGAQRRLLDRRWLHWRWKAGFVRSLPRKGRRNLGAPVTSVFS